ncbi:META domain-containing protein [Pseudidiomarina marina]|uniref:META domain-containing protein n=1 Tax=Pseudidiomarina marina TaxID=502366 RepID=UPI00385025A1
MRLIYALSALGSIIVLTGCDNAPQSTTVEYGCGALDVEATFSNQNVELRFGDQRVALDAKTSASGALYVNQQQELEFWNKGSQAQLTIAGQPYPLCIDKAGLPQQFSARGNEPFWLVHVNNGSASLRQPTGDRDYPKIETSRLNDTSRNTWEIKLRTDEVLQISDAICRDSMSGMPYPYTAKLTRDDTSFSGCAGEPQRLLSGASWQLHASELDKPPTIQFMSDNSVFGYSGCNRFQGNFQLSGEGLSFNPLAATKMMCSQEQMSAEQALFEALDQVTGFEVGDNGNTLQLRNNNETLLRFVKAS